MRCAFACALVGLGGCTLFDPIGLECVSDTNCSPNGTCVAYRCVYPGGGPDAGPTIPDAGSWRVTILAGAPDGGAGFADGVGTAASFFGPSAVALDPTGRRLYVADTGNAAVRVIDLGTKAVTTLSTGGFTLDSPLGVAIDDQGTLYVSDEQRACVVLFSPGGAFQEVAGSCDGTILACQDTNEHYPSDQTAATLNAPSGIAAWAGGLLVADEGNSLVRYASPYSGSPPAETWLVGTFAGILGTIGSTGQACGGVVNFDCGQSVTGAGSLESPVAVAAVGGSDGGTSEIFIAEGCGIHAALVNGTACQLSPYAGGPCSVIRGEASLLSGPKGLAASVQPGGIVLYVSDTDDHRIVAFPAAGSAPVPVAGNGLAGLLPGRGDQAELSKPWGIAVASSGTTLYAADHDGNLVWEIDAQ